MNIYIGGPVVISDMQGPCPDGFHVPLSSERSNIVNAGINLGAWTSSGGNNFSTYLKMPFAGYRDYSDRNFIFRGTIGMYYSSTPNGTTGRMIVLSIESSSIDPNNGYNYPGGGRPIRGLKDAPVVPDSSWTTLKSGSGSAGIFHNATLGLISISSNGSTRYTIMDKNLGATTVYNYGDALTEANCGKVYQWGNNYGFSGDPNTAITKTSGTAVNLTGYGPGNYYESDTWNTGATWDSSNNTNIWGGVSQGTTTKTVEVKNIYIGEVYEYSYDFRNKTTTQLTNDGWTNASSLTTGANGVTANSWTALLNQVSGLSTAMSNAKKVSMTMLMYDAGSLSTSTAGFNLMTGTNYTYQTGFYANGIYVVGQCSSNEYITKSQSVYNTAGDYTLSAEFDFVNKTMSVVFPSVYTGPYNITDADITNAKTNNTIYCPLESDRYIKTIYLKIE